MKNQQKYIAFLLLLSLTLSNSGEFGFTEDQEESQRELNVPNVSSQILSVLVHQQSYGDIVGTDHQWVGHKGIAKRLEGIQLSIVDNTFDCDIEYKVYIQGNGWTQWISDGNYAGTRGQALQIEKFAIRLVNCPEYKYQIRYRGHIQSLGDSPEYADGEECFYLTGKRIESIYVYLVDDTDNDGLNDWLETNTLGTDPNNMDTDQDGMPDGWEYINNLNPLNPMDGSGIGYDQSECIDWNRWSISQGSELAVLTDIDGRYNALYLSQEDPVTTNPSASINFNTLNDDQDYLDFWWFSPSVGSDGYAYITFKQDTGQPFYFPIWANHFGIRDSSGSWSNYFNFDYSTWYHVHVEFDFTNNEVDLWVDGEKSLVDVSVLDYSFINSINMYIHSDLGDTNFGFDALGVSSEGYIAYNNHYTIDSFFVENSIEWNDFNIQSGTEVATITNIGDHPTSLYLSQEDHVNSITSPTVAVSFPAVNQDNDYIDFWWYSPSSDTIGYAYICLQDGSSRPFYFPIWSNHFGIRKDTSAWEYFNFEWSTWYHMHVEFDFTNNEVDLWANGIKTLSDIPVLPYSEIDNIFMYTQGTEQKMNFGFDSLGVSSQGYEAFSNHPDIESFKIIGTTNWQEWTYNPGTATATIKNIENHPNALYLAQGNTPTTSPTASVSFNTMSQDGDSIDFWWYSPSPSSNGYAYLTFHGSGQPFYMPIWGGHLGIRRDTGTWIPILDYQLNQWYQVHIELDFSNNQVDAWIDGQKVGSDIPVLSYSYINSLGMYTHSGYDAMNFGIDGLGVSSEGYRSYFHLPNVDRDTDNDDLSNYEEYSYNWFNIWDGNYEAHYSRLDDLSPSDSDSDNDGISDGDEVLVYNTNPLNALADKDEDGLTDSEEVTGYDLIYSDPNSRPKFYKTYYSNPSEIDSDFDGLTDKQELDFVRDDLSSEATGIYEYEGYVNLNPTNPDSDGDTYNDGYEHYELTTNPGLEDTDSDGFTDDDEIKLYFSNPKDAGYPVTDNYENAGIGTNPSGYTISEGTDCSVNVIISPITDYYGRVIEFVDSSTGGILNNKKVKISKDIEMDNYGKYLFTFEIGYTGIPDFTIIFKDNDIVSYEDYIRLSLHQTYGDFPENVLSVTNDVYGNSYIGPDDIYCLPESNRMYKIDLLMDMDNNQWQAWVDGVKIADEPRASTEMWDVTELEIYTSNTNDASFQVYMDNIKLGKAVENSVDLISSEKIVIPEYRIYIPTSPNGINLDWDITPGLTSFSTKKIELKAGVSIGSKDTGGAGIDVELGELEKVSFTVKNPILNIEEDVIVGIEYWGNVKGIGYKYEDANSVHAYQRIILEQDPSKEILRFRKFLGEFNTDYPGITFDPRSQYYSQREQIGITEELLPNNPWEIEMVNDHEYNRNYGAWTTIPVGPITLKFESQLKFEEGESFSLKFETFIPSDTDLFAKTFTIDYHGTKAFWIEIV
ncbi:hypothetical protein NEF87_002675 [Candidatus Lokiarchaeum ossiferum]|uniref:Uncharacterized protein n=1 Tax=Candidatus Lokiarchaeum ossiferum TaxID=2951803 RepID=A0ABY6HSA1_9ARCH|nr:hypothetical protein NEF87_002675 [Candidatus Lokiarchaeum sp. B-35]